MAPPETTYATFPLRLLTFLIKVPLLVIFSLLFLLVDTFFRFSLGSVSTAAFESMRATSARLLLGVSGFHRVPLSFDGRRRKIPRGSDVLVVNQSSPMDVLLIVWLCPSALFTRCDAGDDMLFETESAFSAFLARFGSPVYGSAAAAAAGGQEKKKKEGRGMRIHDLLTTREARNRVVVVFPEQTTSNNRGLLAFGPIMLDSAFVLSIKYNNPPSLTTPIPGRYWDFLWSLTSVPVHGCRLKASAQKIEFEFADAIARFARIPKTSLGIKDKVEFLRAWEKR